ncbi:cell division protein FtsZ [Niallia circulans]|uniref:Cell division protein FtsZ n=1 Tax=Niallia circulans TaxID=1397 RepID=A0A553SUH4_NIACI|nr:cell division protein FtsZ [Niallia circulans]TRZ40628.1 cell division protein FtsZ [Niallia circulans]
MAKTFTKNQPAINITMVGFGQAGTRMADRFAAFKKEDNTSVYNCIALNSNDGDLAGLKNISTNNRVSLELGGLGKNPEEAIHILERNDKAKDKLKSFIQERIRPQDDLVMFFAGLGGGTGTSTIVKAIEEFYDYNNKPKIIEEFNLIRKELGEAEVKTNPKKYLKEASIRARKKFIKIGIVVTIPTRADGPDALRQVNNFAQQIWDIAKNPNKGVAFVVFADNQHFYDEFKQLPENSRNGIDNYRDYANNEIAEIFHELNTATTGGGTAVTFDSADFRRVILEHTGSLVISRFSKSSNTVRNGHDVTAMFKDAIDSSNLHQPIQLFDKETNTSARIHHIGLLAILDKSNDIGSSFIDDAREEIIEKLPLNGTVFSGYLEEKNNFSTSVYTFFKADALPERLAKGLVKEYEDFKARQQEVSYQQSVISSIAAASDDEDFDLDFAELGLTEYLGNDKPAEKTEPENDIDLDDIDLSLLDD